MTKGLTSSMKLFRRLPNKLHPADVKSAVLALLRRQKVQMTDDFKVKLP